MIVVPGGALAVAATGQPPASPAPSTSTPPAPAASGSAAQAAPTLSAEHAALVRDGLRDLITAARDKVFPALVNINTITVNYFSGKEQKGEMVGSGTIISAEGHILTNAHVVSKGKKFTVTLGDKQEIEATLVGEDPATDLAVIKLNLPQLKAGTKLPVAELGDSNSLQVGDYVMAMGSPFALSRSVTLGIVSNVERVFAGGFRGTDEIEEIDFIDGQGTGVFTNWIQHDALIHPGNSGGPLVDLQGKVIGINTRGGMGIGYASPANLAKEIAEKLVKFGEVPRSSIGLNLRQSDKTGIASGVLITSVASDGPAAKAGLKAGDVLVSINGAAVQARFPEEVPPLLRRIANLPIGSAVALQVTRDGKAVDVSVTTEKLLRDRGDESALRAWGFTVEEITERLARDLRLESRDGVFITGVRGGSPAATAEPQLSAGDIITHVGGTPVKNLQEAVKAYRAVMDSPTIPEFLLIQFDRRGKNQVTLIKPRPKKDSDRPREAAKAWIGIATQPVLRQLASFVNAEGQTGFRITRIYPRTLAAESGLKVGDIITAINDTRLAPRGMQDALLLDRQIERLPINQDATIAVIREGKPASVTLKTERTRLRSNEVNTDTNKDFELSVRELTFFDRDENRWDDSVQGVMITSSDRAGWAGQGGLFPGDLIQRIDNAPVTDLASYRAAMEAVGKAQPERVSFFILRGTRTYFKFVEPEWKPTVPDADKPAEGAKPDGGKAGDAKPAGNP